MQNLISITPAAAHPQRAFDFDDVPFDYEVSLTPEVESLLQHNCVVAIGVSGGKDSVACALAVDCHLKSIGHSGPRLLIHADLGRVEWTYSLPSCQRLAAHIGWELVVVRRKAGDMLARWQGRWENNLARYRQLSCVKIILPWSTPALRFCTSELKVAVITSALRKRFPKSDIVNVAGIRRQESTSRSRMPVSAPMAKLERKGAAGVTWNAIIDWSLDQVLHAISESGLALHEAYTKYGSSRVSCAFCIMGSESDLLASSGCADNQDVYRQMVELEADSTFAFQGNRWLADVAPVLLSTDLRERIQEAKRKAVLRQSIEAELPAHLLFTEGWPTAMPTDGEADLIASVRLRISELLGIAAKHLDGDSVRDRYAELMAAHEVNKSLKTKRISLRSA